MSRMSAGESGTTRMPRRGTTSTSPSLSRRMSASRTGVRLMPSASAISGSVAWYPAAYSSSRMRRLISA